MPSYSGVWTLTAQYQAVGSGTWPPNYVPPTGLFATGYSSSPLTNVINSINISTTGNATDFGDVTVARASPMSCGSTTRGVWAGGSTSGGTVYENVIDYVTFSTAGNATDFGDLTVGREGGGGCNSSTRGVFGGGWLSAFSNVIDYITIASAGNATDFGDLTVARYAVGSCSSSTRGLFSSGRASDGSGGTISINVIDYVTIASAGNATDFGDMQPDNSGELTGTAGCSSSTRGLFGGGEANGNRNTIQYVTIATTGNAADFGDLTQTARFTSACSSDTRGVWGGGTRNGSQGNTIDYVTIASVGNATDFGDLTQNQNYLAACSNVNGGVQ
jgi:hypothetical protein